MSRTWQSLDDKRGGGLSKRARALVPDTLKALQGAEAHGTCRPACMR